MKFFLVSLAVATSILSPLPARCETATLIDDLGTPAPAAQEFHAPRPEKKTIFGILGVFGILVTLGTIRTIQDARMNQTIACPADAATAYSPSVYIGTGPHLERVEVRVSYPALPSLVDAKTMIFALQNSADNVTFNDFVELAPQTALGGGGVGAAAGSLDYRLPADALGYVRLRVTALAAAGDNTAISASLIFLM